LVIGATVPTATTTKLFISDTVNNYLEANIKNLSNGANASSDFVATADNGNDNRYYIDFGINSSGYNNSTLSLQGANDGYLYVSDNKLVISTASTTNSNADIIFSTKGVTPSNERMRITAAGNVGIGTTAPAALFAVQGTSSSPTINLFTVASSTGAQMVTVDYQGNFGINSSTPIADLTLVAHAGDSNPLVEVASATGATYLRVNSNGNVGIGTSTINALLGISVINNSDAVWVNTSGTGNLVRLQQGGTDRFLVGNSGSLTISTSDIDIVKTTSGANLVDTDFNRTANATSSAIVNLDNTNGALGLSSGSVPNSGNGTVTNSTTTIAAVGQGGQSFLRPDGKYYVVLGGGTGTAIYGSTNNTFVATTSLGTAVGTGALVLPRADGKFQLIHGNAGATRTVIDPMGYAANASDASANFCGSAASGTVATLRPDGKYLVTCGGLATTTIFDPVAGTWAAGPGTTGTIAWGQGALALPRPDGRTLFLVGSSTIGSSISSTLLYNPNSASGNIGVFSAGPSLPAGCEIAGNTGSVAWRKPNGKYLILSKQNASVEYDPVAGTFGACSTGAGNGPTVALGDGAHAIPMQNRKLFIVIGGGWQAW
jgi:hypothetical protein